MRIVCFMLLVVFLSISGGSTGKEINDNLIVYLIQDGIKISINSLYANIKKAPFHIVFESDNPFQVLVNISKDSKSFIQAKNNALMNEINGFQGTGMAEGYFNKDLDIMPREHDPQMWDYVNENDSRFNIVSKKNDTLICYRTVENIFTENRKTIPISEYNTKQLYFVIIKYRYKNESRIEEQRIYFKLVFNRYGTGKTAPVGLE